MGSLGGVAGRGRGGAKKTTYLDDIRGLTGGVRWCEVVC